MGWLLKFWVTYKIKLIISSVVLLVICSAFALWLRKHDERLRTESKAEMSIALEKALKEQMGIAYKQIEKDKALVEQDRQQLELDRAALIARMAEADQRRKKEDELHKQFIAWAEKERENLDAEITAIPAPDLVNAVRQQLRAGHVD